MLDQFPRHIYRNKPQAFIVDPMARGLVLEGMQKGDDKELYPIERAFFYLPLEHSEDLNRKICRSLLSTIGCTSLRRLLRPQMQDFLVLPLSHQQQIAHFGRFPHRNAILGRESTPEEIVFLTQWGRRSKLYYRFINR